MLFPIETLRRAPSAVKKGIGFCLAGWAWLILSVYFIYDPGSVFKFIVSALIVGSFLLMLKNWARMLALFCNVLAILYCSVFAVIFWHANKTATLVSLVTIILFGIGSYYLLQKSSAQFFKAQDQPGGSSDPDDTA